MLSDAPLESDSVAQHRLHHGQHARRRMLIGQLIACADADCVGKPLDYRSPYRRLANKLTHCGRYPVVLKERETGELVVSRQLCRSRLCPTCGRIRSYRLRSELLPLVLSMDSPRLITLTLRSSADPLRSQISELLRCWSRLRRRRQSRNFLVGGFHAIEVTHNPQRDQWHPHLHIVADGRYWPQRDLSKLWESVTGGSSVVDIRAAHSRSAVIHYVTKYVTKCQTPDGLSASRLGEWCMAVQGLRMIQTWGTLHGSDVARRPRIARGRMDMVAPVVPLIEDAQHGCPIATLLLLDLHNYAPDSVIPSSSTLAARLSDWWSARLLTNGPVQCYADIPPPARVPVATLSLWTDRVLGDTHSNT